MDQHTESFNIRDFATTLRRRWAWIALPAVVVLAIAIAMSLVQPKKYDATVIMLAGQGEGIADVTAIDAITKATQTLARMGTNRVVVEQALKDLKLTGDLDPVSVTANVRSSVPVNTQQIEITVRDTDPKRAARIANGIGRAFSKMVEENASESSKLSATVWQPALVPDAAASPNLKLNALLGLVLGLMLGLGAALLREQLDQAWKGEEELEELLGVPVLGAIPEISTRTRRERAYA